MVSTLVHVDLLVALHQLRLLVEIVHELLIVALEIVVNHVVEVRLVFDFHLLTIVLQQGCENLTVCVIVPFVGVVLELYVVGLGLAFFAVDNGPVLHSEGSAGHLVSIPTSEGLVVEGEGTGGIEPLLVETLQQVEVELALQETCRVLPLTDLLLKLSLLLNQSDGIDTFVHANGVLPVVGTLGVFRVVLDAHSFVSTHVTDHDVLFYLTCQITGLILCIATFLDAIAGEITACRTRIADCHRE